MRKKSNRVVNCRYCEKEIASHYKIYCNPSCFASHIIRNKKEKCPHCNIEFRYTTINIHKEKCYLNPKNTRYCAVCQKLLTRQQGTTCGHKCRANYLPFIKTRVATRKINNPDLKIGNYKRICFKEHGKKCWVCGEQKVVAVHHINENHEDDRPENLAPLCPTHHQYVHSRYKNEIIPIIEENIKKYLERK